MGCVIPGNNVVDKLVFNQVCVCVILGNPGVGKLVLDLVCDTRKAWFRGVWWCW